MHRPLRAVVVTVLGIAIGACVGDLTEPGDGGAEGGADASVDSSVDAGVDTGKPDTGTPDTGTPDTQPPCGAVGIACCANNACVQGAACCGGACVDIVKDAKNCGRCAHDCLGAACGPLGGPDGGVLVDGGGVCQPVAVGATTDNDPTRLVLDQGVLWFGALNHVGDGGIDGGLYKCDLDAGCGGDAGVPKVLSQLSFANDVATAGPNVYVTGGGLEGVVHVYPKAGQDAGAFPAMNNDALASDGLNLVFFGENSGVYQAALDGTNKLPLHGGVSEGSVQIAYAQSRVFWTQVATNTVRVGTANVNNPTQEFSQFKDPDGGAILAPWGVAPTGSIVAWSTWNLGDSDILVCPNAMQCMSPTRIAWRQHLGYHPGGMIVDGTDVYWLGVDSPRRTAWLNRCASSGCNYAPTILAQHKTATAEIYAGGVASDATFVYYLVGDRAGTTVWRVPKN